MPRPPAPGRLPRTLLACAVSMAPTLVLSAAEEQLDEVVVQASKQGRTSNEIAAALSLIDATQLRQDRVQGLGDLAYRATGLSFQPIGQSNLQPSVMRGLSAGPTSFASSMVLMVDGVPTLSGFGFDDSLVDVERIEILRGPQSTLFGRNAQVGVINVIARAPSDAMYAGITAEFGERDRRALRFGLDGALVEGLLYAGIAGDWTRQDGFIHNTYLDRDENHRERRSGRATLRWTPGEATDITMRYARRRYDDGGSDWGPVNGPRYQVASGTESFNHSDDEALSLDLQHVFSNGLTLQAVTARNLVRDRLFQDTDFRPADLFNQGRDYSLQNLSQEIRLSGRWGNTQWLAGLYADRDDNDLAFRFRNPMRAATSLAVQDNRSLAGFTSWDIPVAAAWSLTAGARLERDEAAIHIPGEAPLSTQWTDFSPKLALVYRPDDRGNAYLSVARGFRAGGYNAFSPQANRLHDAYDPEQLLAFEAGLRRAWPALNLQLELNLYHMDIDDMHVQQILPGTGSAYIDNAATARSSGAELEWRYGFAPGWQLRGNAIFNRTRFRDFSDANGQYDGNHNLYAPDTQGALGLRYDNPHGWYVQADLLASGRIYLDAANRNHRPGFGRLDASAGFHIAAFDISVYVANATDRHYDAVGYLPGIATLYSPPREAGIGLHYGFDAR